MAAFNFPNSPSTNDIHNENGVSFKWNGTVWKKIGTVANQLAQLGVTGISTLTGGINVGTAGTISSVGNLTFDKPGAGIITATKYYGDGSSLSNVTSTTINNNADNRIITGSGTANTLNGEANLTFDGNNLTLAATKYIYLGSTNQFVTGDGSGNVQFRTNSGQAIVEGSTSVRLQGGSSGLLGVRVAGSAGAAQLYYSQNEKLVTMDSGVKVTGITSTTNLNVTGISTFGGVVDIPTVAGTNTNADLSVLFQTATGVIDGGSGLAFNPGENALKVNGTGSSGLNLTGSAVRGDGGALTLTTQNNNGQCDIHLSNIQRFDTGGSERIRIQSTGVVNIGDTTASSLGSRLLQIGKTDRSETYVEIRNSTSGTGGFVWSDGTASDNTGYRGTIEYSHGNDAMYFKTAATERLRITSAGFVGIGEDVPDLKLHVNGTNALPATSGTTPAGHLILRDKAGNASHGMYMGVSNAAPWSSWIQAADANNLATEYPLLLNPNGGKIGIGTNGTTAGVVEVYNETSKINTLTLRTGAGASGYSGLAFASNGLHGREKAAIYFQETNNGAHFTGDIVFALNSASGGAAQVSTSDQKFRIGSAGQWGIGGANYGSSGQVLTSAGSGAAPTWATPSSGAVVAVHSIENGTKTNIDNSGNAQTITWGTFTKTRTDTKLVYNGLLHTFCDASNDSDATGLFISFESSSVSQVKKRHVCRIDVTGVNYRERPISVTGSISASDTNAAETYTVKWGSDTNSSDIGEWWNPNTSNDARFNAQRESVLIIWEVMP